MYTYKTKSWRKTTPDSAFPRTLSFGCVFDCMRSALISSAVWEMTTELTEGEQLFHCGIVQGKNEFFRASLYDSTRSQRICACDADAELLSWSDIWAH